MTYLKTIFYLFAWGFITISNWTVLGYKCGILLLLATMTIVIESFVSESTMERLEVLKDKEEGKGE